MKQDIIASAFWNGERPFLCVAFSDVRIGDVEIYGGVAGLFRLERRDKVSFFIYGAGAGQLIYFNFLSYCLALFSLLHLGHFLVHLFIVYLPIQTVSS